MGDLDKALALYPASLPYQGHLHEGADRAFINTATRIAAFVATLALESGGFRHVKENLNYSAEALQRTWPSRFTSEKAKECEHLPDKIAAIVYDGRMGNKPGEGFKYIGRGLIQTTGHDNYATCSDYLYADSRLIHHPELLESPRGAALSACWFWDRSKCNQLADIPDLKAVRRRVNGGLTGFDEFIKHYERIKGALGMA